VSTTGLETEGIAIRGQLSAKWYSLLADG